MTSNSSAEKFRFWPVTWENRHGDQNFDALLNWEDKLLQIPNFPTDLPIHSQHRFLLPDPGNPKERLWVKAEVNSSTPSEASEDLFTIHFRIWHRKPNAREGWIL